MLGYWAIRIIGRTLRWHAENLDTLKSIRDSGRNAILAFWHGRIFMATYRFRAQGIVVMISQNRDGEYISQVIQRFGYGVARGSSSKGSYGATVEILRAMQNGQDVGLSIDGPRGPRYVAKPGAAFLAKKSANPVIPFSISVEKKWTMNSWDHFQVPKPFSRAVLLVGEPVYVDENASDEEVGMAEAKIQSSLEGLRDRGDSWWGGEPDQ